MVSDEWLGGTLTQSAHTCIKQRKYVLTLLQWTGRRGGLAQVQPDTRHDNQEHGRKEGKKTKREPTQIFASARLPRLRSQNYAQSQ